MQKISKPPDLPDFIVVGEFNEKVGPISKLILSASGQVSDVTNLFDVEVFVLRVMSVELNTDPSDADFVTTMELNESRLVAIIQHISLQDLFARGYVRRIVVAYLTQDQNKILNYFNLFHGYFKKVTELFRKRNYHLFELDIKKRLADLQYTEREAHCVATSATPSQIRESIEEMIQLYQRLKEYDSEPNISSQPPEADSRPTPEIDLSLPDYSPKLLLTLQHAESLSGDKHSRTLEQIAGEDWPEVVRELKCMLSKLKKSDLVLYLENQDLMAAMAQPHSLLKLGYTATLNFNFMDSAWDHQINFTQFEKDDSLCSSRINSIGSNIVESNNNATLLESLPPQKSDTDPSQHQEDNDNSKDNPATMIPLTEESIESFAALLWSYSVHKSGFGLLTLRNQYTFTQHLVFSLLRGRPVVITGRKDHRPEIEDLVQAFSVFVANNSPTLKMTAPNVVPWYTQTLQLQHLSHIKLIGLLKDKDNPIPFSLMKYVTIFHYEKKCLIAPCYRDGDFIGKILNEKKNWPNDSTYLAYVHSQLYEMAVLACLYYHECCIGIPPKLSPPTEATYSFPSNNSSQVYNATPLSEAGQRTFATLPNLKPVKSINSGPTSYLASTAGTPSSSNGSLSLTETSLKYMEKEQSKIKHQHQNSTIQSRRTLNQKQDFFKKHHIKENDAEILEYFAEVVKMQQSASIRGIKKSPIIQLDYGQLFQFDNKPKQRRI